MTDHEIVLRKLAVLREHLGRARRRIADRCSVRLATCDFHPGPRSDFSVPQLAIQCAPQHRSA
jgi:hypothetical protein